MTVQHLAIVLPAFNEAEGLPSFLLEIAQAVSPVVRRLSFVVVDDRSTDDTAGVLSDLADTFPHELIVVASDVNRGHGPSALNAYREGLETGADAILHVDGDGQFIGAEFPAVIAALNGHDGVHGIRRNRTDPWFRKMLSTAVFSIAWAFTRARVSDVNTPLRLYTRGAIQKLLPLVREDSLIPHVHFSLLERHEHLSIARVIVQSIPRRSSAATGTMWGAAARTPILPPKRLRQFVVSAGLELWRERIARWTPAANEVAPAASAARPK